LGLGLVDWRVSSNVADGLDDLGFHELALGRAVGINQHLRIGGAKEPEQAIGKHVEQLLGRSIESEKNVAPIRASQAAVAQARSAQGAHVTEMEKGEERLFYCLSYGM
jgi:hypothetical protein